MNTSLICAINGYGVTTAVSVIAAAFVLFFVSKKRGLYEDFAFEALLYMLIPAFLFARLYYVIFTHAALSTSWTFSEFFGLGDSDGTLSAIGAIIGAVVGLGIMYAVNRYLYNKDPDKYAHRNVTFAQMCDAVAVAAIFALGAGRWGDLIDKRSMGDLVTNDANKWFPLSVCIDDKWYYATFFYEFVWDMLVFALMLWSYVGKRKSFDGFECVEFLILYGIGRAVIDGMRIGELWLIEDVLKIDQVFAIVMVFAGILLLFSYIVGARRSDKKFFVFVADSELTSGYYGEKPSRVNKPSLESLKKKEEKITFEEESEGDENPDESDDGSDDSGSDEGEKQ